MTEFESTITKDVRVTFEVTYNTTELSFYTKTKDVIDKIAHILIF